MLKTFANLISGIEKGEYGLPTIQRDFVWSIQQQIAFFESVENHLPIGSFLFWPYPVGRPPILNFAVKSISTNPNTIFLVLDGQQRLTTVYRQYQFMNTKRNLWGAFDGRSFKVIVVKFIGNRIVLKPASPKALQGRDSSGSDYIELPCLLSTSKKKFDDACAKISGKKKRDAVRKFRDHLRTGDVYVEELPKKTTLSVAAKAFKQINSQGSRLGIVDIAAVNLYEAWPDLNTTVDRFHKKRYRDASTGKTQIFEKTTLLKCLMHKVYGKSDASSANKEAEDNPKTKDTKVRASWKKTEDRAKRFERVLEKELGHTKTDKYLQNYLFVALEFFKKKNVSTVLRDRKQKCKFFAWYILANISRPFTGGGTVDKVRIAIDAMARSRGPDWQVLFDQLVSEQTRTCLVLNSAGYPILDKTKFIPLDAELSNKSKNPHLTQLYYLFLVRAKATDWVNTSRTLSASNRSDFQLHHIWPQKNRSRLEHFNKKKYRRPFKDHIGNLAWVTDDTNVIMSNKDPVVYLGDLKKLHGTTNKELAKQRLSSRSTNIKMISTFDAFVRVRTGKLIQDCNDLLNDWYKGKSH